MLIVGTVMREEIETGMRLLGVTSVDQLRPELLSYMDKRLGKERMARS